MEDILSNWPMGKALKVDTNLDKNQVVKSGQTIFRKIPQEFEECTYQKRHSSTLLKKDHQKFFKIHLSTQKSRYLLKRFGEIADDKIDGKYSATLLGN